MVTMLQSARAKMLDKSILLFTLGSVALHLTLSLRSVSVPLGQLWLVRPTLTNFLEATICQWSAEITRLRLQA
jgi:hypothetical protein